jgi:outer membrane lipoprotein-sorting protein
MTLLRIAATLLLASAAAAQQPGNLDATLKALDQSSAHFTSAQAAFHKDLYTALVKDHDLQEGITYAIRKNGASEVGIKITGKGARTVVYKDGTARDYNPGTNCYDSYSAAKSKGTIESLLALSFGASGKELAANWTVTDLGPDTITTDGRPVKVEKLDLTPKEQGLRNNITHVQLWTDLTTAISLKQVVFSPSGDTQTATYSIIRLNKDVDKGPFKIEGKPCK